MKRHRLTHSQLQALRRRLEAVEMASDADAEHDHLRAIVQIAESVLPSPAPADDTLLQRLAARLNMRLDVP